MTISVKTYQQILGEMVRKLLPNTPLNDINDGSVLMTLLEAAATSDFENNAAVLNVLELLSIDAIRNNDLDAKGADYGLTRLTAQKASGLVTITDSTITKRSTTLYALKLPPIANSTKIYVNDASQWDPAGGSLYIGRGTQSFEGPIPYTSIQNNGSFYTINLTSALKKDHLISDTVVDQQGKLDRRILAGSTVLIPANNQNPEIAYTILRDAVIPGGEDTVINVQIMAQKAGSLSNAGIGTIVEFGSLPFTGATVTNTSALTDGRDVETDVEFRERIKSYTSTLSRGTRGSILSAIIGVSDAEDNKQVQSAVLQEPPKAGDPSIVYLDDGRGFQPSFAGQSVDSILVNASGSEEFLQLANYPLPRPQVINTEEGPYRLVDGMKLHVYVDGIEESVEFDATDFKNIAAATLAEIVIAINADETISFRARLAENSTRLLLYPSDADTETIQVVPIRSTDDPDTWANTILGFPTSVHSYISLYRNNTLLKEKETAAALVTVEFANWGVENAWEGETLSISIDGTPSQAREFTEADFGGQPLGITALEDWVAAINAKYAGLTAEATSSGAILLTSNKKGALSSIEITGGTLANSIFGAMARSSQGRNADFQLNRQTGNLRILSGISAGDSITAGALDTKGTLYSSETATGVYPLSVDSNGRPAETVIVADAKRLVVRPIDLAVGTQVTFSASSSSLMRILTNSISTLASVQPGDYIYVTNRGDISGVGDGLWADIANCGLFRILTKGAHTSAGVDTYVEVANTQMLIPYQFAVSGVTTMPSIGDQYSHNGSIYAITKVTAPSAIYATRISGTTQPLASGILTRISGSGDATIGYATVGSLNSYTARDITDIQAYYGDSYPQVWRGYEVPTPSGASIADIIAHLNTNLLNTKASLFKTSFIKETTTTESDGSIATPISIGNAKRIFATAQAAEFGNQSHIANRRFNQDAVAFFKRSQPTKVHVPLDRWINTDIMGAISVNSAPQTISDPYGELLTSSALNPSDTRVDDQIAFHHGSNKRHFRAIKELQTGNIAGTQHQLPRTLFDHIPGDELTIMKSFMLHPDDNIVFIMDQDSISKTIVVPMSRTGRIHSLFPANNQSFSAYDQDNEPGITFDDLRIWGKTTTNTEFKDYAVWFRARNWYASEGVGSPSGGKLLLRAKEYGPHGEKIRFRLAYPLYPNFGASMTYSNSPVETEVQYVFASGGARAISLVNGTAVTVSDLGSDIFSYIFPSGSIDLSAVQVGDVVGIAPGSGFSAANRGSFRIIAKTASSFAVRNPSGYAAIGAPEITKISCAVGPTGTYTSRILVATDDLSGSLDGKYFTLYDNDGQLVVVYYDTTGTTPAPSIIGASRYIKVQIAINEVASEVARKTCLALNTDIIIPYNWTATWGYNPQFTIVNTAYGAIPVGSVGTTGFYMASPVVGTPDYSSVDGKYIRLYDNTGSVIVWFSTSSGATIPPVIGDRDIKVLIGGADTIATVAAKMAAAITADPNGAWTVTYPTLGDFATITLTDTAVGARIDADQGSTLFAILVTQQGIDGSAPETITLPSAVNIFPLTANTTAEIAAVINTSPMLTAVALGDTGATICKATGDETYIPSSTYSNSLAYGHEVGEESVGLYDSMSWVKTFQNTGPNFLLKTTLVLQNACSLYEMGTTANPDSSDTGELFKLVPVTLQNVHHQFTHKALSQLPIISDVEVVNAFRSIQLKSKQLGTSGAIEIVGGKANTAEFSVIGDAQASTANGTTLAEVKIIAAPSTLNIGDYVKITNANDTKRKSRLTEDHTVDVIQLSPNAEYRYNPSVTLSGSQTIAIADVSSSHGRTGTGTVWRWTAATGSFLKANIGDLLIAHDFSPSWGGNQLSSGDTGEETIGGFPIIAVDTTQRAWVEVINPTGSAKTATAIGSGKVKVVPTPAIRWRLTHDTATTHYRIESLGFNDLYRLRCVGGASPKFFSCGVATDDLLIIKGSTFNTNNAGAFRVLAVTEDYLLFQNTGGIEELDYIRPFNNSRLSVTWEANANIVVANTANMTNVQVGDWVKKLDDDDTYYVQVLAKTVVGSTTELTLAANYKGTSGSALGVAFNSVTGANAGNLLQNTNDVAVFDGDSVQNGDYLFIDDIVNDDWFDIRNTGTHPIIKWGTASDYRPFIRIENSAAAAETGIDMAVNVNALYVIEGLENKTELIKEVRHVAIDEFDSTRRILYLTSPGMTHKISQTNGSKISALGKLDFDTGTTTGIDGYLYYTGLMRKVQRVIDGYEPDATTYPGRRAVGGMIELLPPLIKRITLALVVGTKEGVNLNEISNDILTVVTKYVNTRGVGEDVVLSDIIVRVMAIKGVASVTFSYPPQLDPTHAVIQIGDIEKPYIEPTDISIA